MIGKNITLVAWYKILYFQVAKRVVSDVYHGRYIMNAFTNGMLQANRIENGVECSVVHKHILQNSLFVILT